MLLRVYLTLQWQITIRPCLLNNAGLGVIRSDKQRSAMKSGREKLC